MSINFLNPLILFGLAAGILPILIHRLTHRKAVRRTFSAVRLLIHSQHVTARPQRLKHLLLLILRVMAVVTLILMAARPILVHPGLLALGETGTKVLVIDNSVSMGYHDAQGERFGRAKKIAMDVARTQKGQMLLVPMAAVQGRSQQEGDLRWTKPEEALREVDSMSLAFGRGDPASALSLAFGKLQHVKDAKEIVVLSDMARGEWQRFDAGRLGTLSADTHITFLRVGGPARDANWAVKGVSTSDGEVVVGTPFHLDVTVSNMSGKAGSSVVQVILDDVKVDQKSIEVNAGEDGTASFELFPTQAGWINGTVRLSEDNLPYDDVFYFPLNVRGKVSILVVDGDPRSAIRASESYYLARALRPGDSEESPFQVRVITEREFAEWESSRERKKAFEGEAPVPLGGTEGATRAPSMDLKQYAALFLLNVARPQASRIASFLDAGKSVFIFLGDKVVAEAYNTIPLFPWRLREVRETAAQRPERIGHVDYSHSALGQFSRIGKDSLGGVSFRRYFRVEGGRNILLALENKDPLLVESSLGKGKLFLYASSADLDWNDLPLKAVYVPLLQGLVREAAGLTGRPLGPDTKVGDPFEEKVQPAQITGPRGGPGIYQFLLSTGEVRRAVNIPPEESDLSKMVLEDIKKAFPGMSVKVVEYKEGSADQLQGERQELWRYLLGFLLVTLAVELGVANKL
jgi:hypothetical protein